jgi:glycerophosphoryl diester phosphodiesterase
LTEALDILPKDIWLNIHLKGGAHLGSITAKIIVDHKREHQAIFACDSLAYEGIMSVDESLITCNMERQGNRERYINNTIEKNHKFIQLLRRRNDDNLKGDVKLLRESNVKINFYGSDSPTEIKELFDIGIDFILVNKLSESIKITDTLNLDLKN